MKSATYMSIVFACLSIAGFSSPGNAQNPPPKPNERAQEQAKRTITVPAARRIAEQENAPMLILYREAARPISSEPQLFLALWRDGTIVWYRADDKKLDGVFSRAEHFQSKILEKKVEDFLSAFGKSDFFQYSEKGSPMRIEALMSFLLMETKDMQFRFTMDGINWADRQGAPRSQETQQMADAWRTMLGLLRDLCPEKGEKISVRFSRTPDKSEWQITPIPLGQDRPNPAEEAAKQKAIQEFNKRRPNQHLNYTITVKENEEVWWVWFHGKDGVVSNHTLVMVNKATGEARLVPSM